MTDEATNENAGADVQANLSPQVSIVGAVPTGLTRACELAQAAFPTEALPGPQPGSRSKCLGLTPDAFAPDRVNGIDF